MAGRASFALIHGHTSELRSEKSIRTRELKGITGVEWTIMTTRTQNAARRVALSSRTPYKQHKVSSMTSSITHLGYKMGRKTQRYSQIA